MNQVDILLCEGKELTLREQWSEARVKFENGLEVVNALIKARTDRTKSEEYPDFSGRKEGF